MADVPKIVHHRLRASLPEQQLLERAHPEADLLTAFAEQALSATEREGVLQHLALCADCRDVVALAVPTAELALVSAEPQSEIARTPVPAKVRPHTSWFAWANLHWTHLGWTTLTAGIVVAILVLRPGLERRWNPSQPVSSGASQSSAPAQLPASASPSGSIEKSRTEDAVEAKASRSGASLDSLSNNRKAATVPSPKSNLPAMVASNRDKKPAFEGNPAARNLFHFATPNAPRTAIAAGNAFEPVPAAPADSTPADDLMARAYAPAIGKAKPPLKDSETANESQKKTELPKAMVSTLQAPEAFETSAGMAALRAAAPTVVTSKQNANWTIAAGVLQRSLDNGRSWQTAVRADHALLCYANRENEVWAGGQAGTLLHSTDGGATWSAVAVSFKGHPLSADVGQIDLKSPAGIVLATGNGETWSSGDSGKTWEKK